MKTIYLLVAIFNASSDGATVKPLEQFSTIEQCVDALNDTLEPTTVAYFTGQDVVTFDDLRDLDCIEVKL